MTDRPTLEQIRAYLSATGWGIESTGPAGAMWTRSGPGAQRHRIGVVDDPSAVFLNGTIGRIARAEGRLPASVCDDIRSGAGAVDARISVWAFSSLCDRAAVIVRGRLADAADDGWPGVWDHRVAEAMCEQAAALATALEKTATLINAAFEADPPYPRHPLWTAAAKAAEAILLAEPAEPDDIEALKRRLNAMRAEAKEQNQ